MKHLWIVMIALCALVLSGLMVSAQAGGLSTLLTERVNIRTGPSTDFDAIRLLAPGTAINIDGRTESGAWLRGIIADGTVGWVVSGAVEISLAQLNGLPFVGVDTPFLLSPPSGAPSASGATGGGAVIGGLEIVAANNINVRSGPGVSFDRVAGLFTGQAFRAEGRNSDGDWIRGSTPDGTIGWVSVPFMEITVEQLIGLPEVSSATPFGLQVAGGQQAEQPQEQVEQVQAAPPIASTAPVTGFSYGGHVASMSDSDAQWMYRAGMTWVKYQIRYSDGQGAGGFAGRINDAHNRGFRILLGVVGSGAELNNPGYFERYAGFVAGLAALGADAIEIWNEPNIDREWPAPVDPARYTQLLAASYNAIKAANPNVLVISGAPAPTGAEAAFPGGQVMNDDRYLAGMAAAGATRYMDCVGVHYNEGIVPPNWTSGDPRGDYYTRYLRSMIDVYYNAFGGARPLCFTELGYLTSEGYGPLSPFFGWAENVTVADQAAWLDGAINLSRRSGRVRMVIIWNVDFTNYGADPMAGYAMIRPGGGCPACEALGN